MTHHQYQSLAFDLDDTLLDTSGILVPVAATRACQAMLDAGVRCTMDQCLDMRAELAPAFSHTEIFTKIADRFGTNTKGKAIHDALDCFYNPEVPASLPLLPGALENLEALQKKYALYLVTVGAQETQLKKIRALGVEKYFKKLFVLNGFIGEKKELAFQEIIKTEKHPADQLLSIGNRLSSEIRDGKRAGANTCYFAFGEHVGEKAEYPEDHPDYTITAHKDLIKTCGL